MAKMNGIYKCEICGNVVTVLHEGAGQLVCCGKPMQFLVENTVDASKEKHVPIIEKVNDGYQVTLGSILHPMEEKHYIEWIELETDGKVYREFLKPGAQPTAFFAINATRIRVRAYCNLHGLWQA